MTTKAFCLKYRFDFMICLIKLNFCKCRCGIVLVDLHNVDYMPFIRRLFDIKRNQHGGHFKNEKSKTLLYCLLY